MAVQRAADAAGADGRDGHDGVRRGPGHDPRLRPPRHGAPRPAGCVIRLSTQAVISAHAALCRLRPQEELRLGLGRISACDDLDSMLGVSFTCTRAQTAASPSAQALGPESELCTPMPAGLRIQRMPSEPGQEFGEPGGYPYMVVCSPSCHDTSTTRAWFEEDASRRERFCSETLGIQVGFSDISDLPTCMYGWIDGQTRLSATVPKHSRKAKHADREAQKAMYWPSCRSDTCAAACLHREALCLHRSQRPRVCKCRGRCRSTAHRRSCAASCGSTWLRPPCGASCPSRCIVPHSFSRQAAAAASRNLWRKLHHNAAARALPTAGGHMLGEGCERLCSSSLPSFTVTAGWQINSHDPGNNTH